MSKYENMYRQLVLCAKQHAKNFGYEKRETFDLEGEPVGKPNYFALQDLKKLVDRETPKKLINIERFYYVGCYDVGECPICEEEIELEEINYCPNCGQALDWSEKDEIK